MIKTKTLLAAFTIGGLAGSASAATLAYYDIVASLTVADSEGAAGLAASTMDATSAGGTSSNFEWVGSRVPYWFTNGSNGGSLGSGTDPQVADILATFSLTPDSGNTIDIGTSGAFDLGTLAYATGTNGTTTEYISTVRIFVASDAAFTNILATSTTLSDLASTGDSTPTLGSLDLDVAVASSSTLYFGVAMQDHIVGSVGGSPNSRFDGIAVNGTVVPEPSSLILLGLGGLLVGRRRRG